MTMLKNVYRLFFLITILSLPWQTRWIISQGHLGSTAWESGTFSFYASWIPMLIAIIAGAGLLYKKRDFIDFSKYSVSAKRLIGFSVLAFFIASIGTASGTATIIWFLQIGLLALFFVLAFLLKQERPKILFWFLIALIPHIGLGIWQYLYQDISASTVLGIAAQHPWLRGPSVIEHGLYRVLRAYGGFPHPNIFGGWLAIAISILPFLLIRSKTSLHRIGVLLFGALALMTLFVTYSRSAWLAAAIGFSLSWIVVWLRSSHAVSRFRLLSFSLILVCSLAFCIVTQWDHFITRFSSTERLEIWSAVSREKAGQESIEAAKQRPLFGWGQGAALAGVSAVRSEDAVWKTVAPEPPHAIPLVVFLETGIVGFAGIFILWILLLRRERIRVELKKFRHTVLYIVHPVLLTAIVLSFYDHYFWTTWSGQVLFMVALLLMEDEKQETISA